MDNRLLLDTCAILWLATDSDSLSTVARLAIEEAIDNGLTVVTGDRRFAEYGVSVLV